MKRPQHHTWRRVCLFFASSFLCFALPCTPALAGPPFITDDPEPVDFRAWEINYGLIYLRAAGVSSGSLPSLDINYGVYPGVQLHIQPQAAYSRSQDGQAYGLGDTEIGVKYRLTEETKDKSAWMLAIYPMLELPTGSAHRGLGAGAHSVFLPLWAQTTRGNWTVFGGGGYRRDSQTDARNSWAGGVTVLYQVSERLQVGGEVFGSTRSTAEGRASIGTNFGGVVDLGGGLALLFSAGHGLRNARASDQGAVYLGLRVAY
jgi:hypothetical protein